MSSSLKAISKLWDSFEKEPFPQECVGLEVKEHCLVLLDSTMAGCLSSFAGGSKGPSLDKKRLQILEECNSDLASVISELPANGKNYFQDLLTLSQEVVNYCKRKT